MNNVDFGGRKEIFRALVGSHNYNMNNPESDKDFKIFVMPLFQDLYNGKQFSKLYISDTEDLDVHDIRKLSNLLWKSNINFVEILFSEEFIINKDLDNRTKEIVQFFLDNKNEIARMNLPYLWNACIGMHLTKKKQINKGTEGTQYLVNKHGYDTKQAMHCLRVLLVLQRYTDNDFTDFKKAIWFDDTDKDREFLLLVRHGYFNQEEILKLADNLLFVIEDVYREKYMSQTPNTELLNTMMTYTEELVRIWLGEELNGYKER